MKMNNAPRSAHRAPRYAALGHSVLGAFFLFLVFFSALGTWGPALSYAAVPKLLTYQGILKDSSGNLLTGTYSMVFRLYDAATGGNAVWNETQSSVSASSGKFSVQLGSVTTLNLGFSADYWLSIQVGSDAEMTPRVRLTSSGYAVMAEDVTGGKLTPSAHSSDSHMSIEGVKSAHTNVAKTNFKLDAYSMAAANSMGDMIVDTFNDASGIDSGASSNYTRRGSPNYDVVVGTTTVVKHPGDYTTNLKGYWKLNESSGTRVDETSNDNDLTENGSVSSGTAARSDSTNYTASIDIPEGGNVGGYRDDANCTGLEPTGSGGSFSIALWVYVRNFTNGNRSILAKGRWNTGYRIRFNTSGNLAVGIEGTDYTTTAAFSTNTWYHIGFVFDEANDKVKVYQNGTLLQEWTSVTTQLANNGEAFKLAYSQDYNVANALIDDIGFWNNVQSSTTFDELYNGASSQSGNADVRSIAFSEPSAPVEVIVIADETLGTGSITYSVSRNNGTNWTTCTKEAVCSISSQPSGTQLKWKAVINGNAELNAISVAVN